MKKILLIALLGFVFTACEQTNAIWNRTENSDKVQDEFGVDYSIVTIEGCEFYMTSSGDGNSGLTKVDCDCVPDKSGR
jgi:hypothetical protein